MSTIERMRVLLVGAWVGLGSSAWAQMEMTDEPPEDESVMRGPTVPTERSRTLVGRAADGRFEPLEQRAEVAAIQRMRLDDATRERAMAIVDARRMAVAMLLVDEIDLLRDQTDAIREGRREEAAEMLRAMWERFDPERSATPLIEPMRGVLSEEEFAEFRRLVEGYWEAWIDWELRNRMGAGEDARERVRERLAFGWFQREVREGYEASLRRYQQAMDGIYAAVEPTDEQRQAIRSIVIEHIKKTRLDATSDERRAVMHTIYDMLDAERQRKFFDYLLRQVIRDE